MSKSGFYLLHALLAVAMLALTARLAASQATVIKSSETIPEAGFQAFDPCSGDTITFTSGNLLLQFTITFNNNNVSVAQEAIQQNVRGIGSPSGLSLREISRALSLSE